MSKAPSPFTFKMSNVCSWSSWTFYVCFQFACVFKYIDILSDWRIWASVLAEALITLPEMLFLLGTTLTLWELPRSSKARESYHLCGDTVPSVDVFVTCAGESNDTVMDTVKAATAQDYPIVKFRVLLLDDGGDASLEHAVHHLNHELSIRQGPAVHYLARPAEQHRFGKAGNLQFGIEWTGKREGSEYIASLDADMITEPDWLRRLVPHAIVEHKVGLVNPPQVSADRADIQPMDG